MKMQNELLNQMEKQVLLDCLNLKTEFDGTYFQSEDVKSEGLSKSQIKGYLSQLKQKGLIDTQENCYYSAFLTELGKEYIRSLENWTDNDNCEAEVLAKLKQLERDLAN